MEGHIHLSVVSVAATVAIVILTNYALHMLSLKLGASESESKQQWGAALAAGFGF